METSVMRAVVDAQQANATLAGHELRAAAQGLRRIDRANLLMLKAFDAVGERIIGAALAMCDDFQTYDYSRPFPDGAACLLVGGFVAGPVGIAASAQAARAAGATRVEVACLGGWDQSIGGVDAVHDISTQPREISAA